MKKIIALIFVLAVGIAIGLLYSNYQNRPCIVLEKQIRAEYVLAGESEADNFMQRLSNAEMYAELSEKGCAENREDYKAKTEQEFKAAEDMAVKAVPEVSAEIKIDMQKVQAAVNDATKAAAEAMGGFIEKMKNTKVSITVE